MTDDLGSLFRTPEPPALTPFEPAFVILSGRCSIRLDPQEEIRNGLCSAVSQLHVPPQAAESAIGPGTFCGRRRLGTSMASTAKALDCLVGGGVGCSTKQTGRILTGASPASFAQHLRRGGSPSAHEMLGLVTYCLEPGSRTSTATHKKNPVQRSTPAQASMGDTSSRDLADHTLASRPNRTRYRCPHGLPTTIQQLHQNSQIPTMGRDRTLGYKVPYTSLLEFEP